MIRSRLMTIKKALCEIDNCEIKVFAAQPVEGEALNDSYIYKSDELIKRTNKYFKTISFKRAMTVILVAALFLAFAVTAYAYREPILNFIEKMFSTHISLSATAEPKLIDKVYVIEYIPDGFDVTQNVQGKASISMEWKKSEEYIYFNQHPINNTKITLDTENGDYIKSYIGEQAVYYSVSTNTYCLAWENGDYSFMLILPNSLPWDEVERIFLSISPRPLSENEP